MKLDSSKTLKPVPQTNWKADFIDQLLVFEEKRKLEKPEKTHRSREENQPQTYVR